ncbi:MAG: GGDEF domain-containing protein [Planctomycetota bacterium]|jgi:diguanylate cyclase (GGDEF)-like protein|nr:GGDEF domain-containing protein [Planctomycetota bacterium]
MTTMGDGLRTLHIVTTDESIVAQCRAASAVLDGWEVCVRDDYRSLLSEPPAPGDVILIDKFLRGGNVYETCSALVGKTRSRIFVVCEFDNKAAESIARFCGATGVLRSPISASQLRVLLDESGGPRPNTPEQRRGTEEDEISLPEALLVEIATGKEDKNLVQALVDPETSLFNYGFLNYKLDEEFKRAQRFRQPLSCVMLGFEGQADGACLRELSSIFLCTSRDTDVLGRFDENSFLFLLPNTGPDGARIMADRVREMATERGLKDLVGDPMDISVGISWCPQQSINRKEDLYTRAREAFVAARNAGGGVVTC